MKTSKIIAVALAATIYSAGVTSCDDYDDSGIKQQISSLDKRLSDLETKVKTDISAIQATIATINGNDFVKSVKEVEGGYEITFSKGTVAVVKKLTTVTDPVLTVAQDVDGKFYWKSNGEWLLDQGAKVPVSLAPDLKIKDFEGRSYWQMNGEWLLGADGKKVEAVVNVDPIQLDVKENADGSLTFVLGDKEYKIPVAAGGLTIVDPFDGVIFSGSPLTYQVALPTGWAAADLDVVRADIESASASGIGITRATGTEKWAVTTAKTETGATVTVTGTDIPANEVAELSVTFVKKSGERLTGSIFATVWATNTNKATITLDGSTTVVEKIKGYMDAKTANTKLEIAGSTAISAADWEALKSYKYLSELTISNSAATAVMPAAAFKGCAGLTKVDLTGSTFAAIPDNAFEGCAGLTSVTGTANILSVGASAFKGCEALTTLATASGVATVGSYAFEGCKVLTAPTLATLTSIGQYAFSGCETMAALPTLDATVEALPAGVFKNCKGLTSAVTLANIKSIGNEAFFGCAGIPSATFAAATTVGNSAFYGCRAMTAATLASATTIGNEAFAGCRLMTALELGTVASVGTNVFASAKPDLCSVTLGAGTTYGNPNVNLATWMGIQWDEVIITPAP